MSSLSNDLKIKVAKCTDNVFLYSMEYYNILRARDSGNDQFWKNPTEYAIKRLCVGNAREELTSLYKQGSYEAVVECVASVAKLHLAGAGFSIGNVDSHAQNLGQYHECSGLLHEQPGESL